jgi:hypothetical protein
MKFITFAIVFATLAAAHRADGQACQPADSLADQQVASIRHIVTSTESHLVATRTAMNLPAATAQEVSYVSDEATCARLAAVYRENAGPAGPESTFTGRVFVVKVRDVYVVQDPGARSGEFGIELVLDSQDRVLARIKS